MEQILQTDKLLVAFFNEYLSLEVFGIKISYSDGRVTELGKDHQLEGLLSWCEQHRWTYFIKSKEYTEYRLCSRLFTTSPWQPFNGPEVHRDFCRWTNYLFGTHGQVLIELWTRLDVWNSDYRELRAIRESCASVPGIHKYSHGGPTDPDAWIEALKKECEDRLTQYWVPRFMHAGQRAQPITSCDWDPFECGLRVNQRAGQPFQAYLIRCAKDENYTRHLKAWEALDQFMLTQHSRGDHYVLQEAWRLWTQHMDTEDEECCVTVNNKELLLRNLSDFSRISVVKTMSLIQNELLSGLKRVWTAYLRHDHQTFLQCIQDSPLLPSNDHTRQSQVTKSRKPRKSKKDRDPSTFDLKNTPLEPLADFETLLMFEQFLFTKCGPKSQANINYHMWKSLMQLSVTTEPKKRDSLAVHVHRTYLYSEAKRCLLLPDSLLEQIDTRCEVTRPSSPVLKSLTEFSRRYLETTVNRFLGQGQDEVTELLPQLDSPKRPRRSKICTAMRQRSEAQHLLFTLGRCDGPLSRQLQAFSEYLEHQCPPTQQRQLSNNVKFWFEVHKFKAMFSNETNIGVMYHKGEAIVDRYLDTTSLPWVKVTVPGELAVQVVSAVTDLRRVEVLPHLERLYQLLERAQEMTFNDIAPYWGTFCAQYSSPTGSSISIPTAVEPSPPCSRKPSLRLPPLTHTTIHTPLLSFSSLKGLKWKTSLHNPQL